MSFSPLPCTMQLLDGPAGVAFTFRNLIFHAIWVCGFARQGALRRENQWQKRIGGFWVGLALSWQCR